ncbi:MAG: cupin domain-containing protein [Calditrichaeota bacterium]|nr:cupin domain-containing protein [Calditrichota bacterium]
MKVDNLFQSIPKDFKNEFFESIINNENFKLERIISKGHSTPKGEWYDQDMNEWVILLKGAAELKIEGQEKNTRLNAGDNLLLPAHLKHRVEWTAPDTETFWLALHFK